MSELDDFIAGYVEAATWADLIQSDDPDAEWGSEAGEYGVDSLDAVSLESVRGACATFVRENRADLEDYAQTFSWDYAGHDFWLTRRGPRLRILGPQTRRPWRTSLRGREGVGRSGHGLATVRRHGAVRVVS